VLSTTSARHVTRSRAERRTGFGIFLGADYEQFKADATGFEDDFKSHTTGINVQLAYMFSNTFDAGFGVRYAKLNGGRSLPAPPPPSPPIPIESMHTRNRKTKMASALVSQARRSNT
jgi:hypothetical protein